MANALEPAFPGSIKDREQGKFRPGITARQTTVAVSDDGGRPLGFGTDDLLVGILQQLREMNGHLALITGEEELDASDD